MAIKISQGFRVGSRTPIDTRLLMTKNDMLNVDERVMPARYFTICQETGEIYLFNVNDPEPSAETGKFKPFGISLGEAEDGQIIMYQGNEWKAVDLADEKSIIYLSNSGLQIKGYDEAEQGYMLVKDTNEGISWIKPLSEEVLNQKVAEAAEHARQAGISATSAGNSAASAQESASTAQRINEQTMAWVNDKFWWGTIEEYNQLEEITEGTFYFVQL